MATEHIILLNIEGPAASWWRHIVPATQDMFFRCDVISVNAVLNSFQFKKFTRGKLDELFILATENHMLKVSSIFILKATALSEWCSGYSVDLCS
jgi:hypothetical protein